MSLTIHVGRLACPTLPADVLSGCPAAMCLTAGNSSVSHPNPQVSFCATPAFSIKPCRLCALRASSAQAPAARYTRRRLPSGATATITMAQMPVLYSAREAESTATRHYSGA